MAELDLARIAAAALAVTDKKGVAGFTMRSVADELGVSPMALYHYVDDKSALAALVVDATILELPLPSSTGEWREDLFAMALWTRSSMLAHPFVAHIRREYNVWTPAMLQMSERWLSIWQQAGLELAQAVFAARISSLAITGIVNEEMVFRTMQLPDKKLLAGLPNVRAVYGATPDRDLDFKVTVTALIGGIHAQFETEGRRAPVLKSKKSSRRVSRTKDR